MFYITDFLWLYCYLKPCFCYWKAWYLKPCFYYCCFCFIFFRWNVYFFFISFSKIDREKWVRKSSRLCLLFGIVSKLKSWELLKMDFWRVVFPHFFSLLPFFINFFRISIAFCSLRDIAFNFKYWIIFFLFNPISIYLLFYLWTF